MDKNMTKLELAARNRVYRRAEMALRRVADIARLNEIIYNNAIGDADNFITSRISNNLELIRQDLQTLKNRNRI